MKRLGVVAVLLLLVGCDAKDRATVDGQIKQLWDSVSDRDYIRTRGIGAADQSIQNKTQRMATAREAALTQARYEMLVFIKGAHLEGGITVSMAMEKSSEIKALVDRLIRGAEEVKDEWLQDDGCVVTIELQRSAIKRMVKEDEKWERLKWERERESKRPSQSPYLLGREIEYAPGRKSPVAAGLWGTLVPGGSLLYAGGDYATWGWWSLGITSVLVGVGVSELAHPKGASGNTTDTSGTKESNKAAAPWVLAAGGICWAISDYVGVQAVKEGNLKLAVYPTEGGAGFALTQRF